MYQYTCQAGCQKVSKYTRFRLQILYIQVYIKVHMGHSNLGKSDVSFVFISKVLKIIENCQFLFQKWNIKIKNVMVISNKDAQGHVFFNAWIWLYSATSTWIPDCPNCKISWRNLPWPKLTRRHSFEGPIYTRTLTRQLSRNENSVCIQMRTRSIVKYTSTQCNCWTCHPSMSCNWWAELFAKTW